MTILNIVGKKETYLKNPKRTRFIAQSEQCRYRKKCLYRTKG